MPQHPLTNRDRAAWAHEAVQRFAEITGLDADNIDFNTKAGDLLSSLMHLTRIEGHDFDEILERARSYFQWELEHEGESGGSRKEWDPREV